MRTLKLLSSALALAVVVAPAAGRAETRVGIINISACMEQIEEAKAVGATLKKEMEERQQKLDARQTEWEKAKAEYEKQASVMNEQAKKEKESELGKRLMELQQLADTMRNEFGAKQEELLLPVQNRVNLVVKEVAEAEGLQLVVRNEAVFYGVPSLDITNEVVRRYNVKFPRKGGAAPAKAEKPAEKKPAGAAKGK